MEFSTFLTGLMMSLSLIVAIGAQNAFVLRQGLRDEHVLPVCLTCAVSDAALIVLGVAGFARVTAAVPWLDPTMRYAGAAFLVWYGSKSLHSALTSTAALDTEAGAAAPALSRSLAACLAITWLNPHVYLDTVVLLGAVSSRFPGGKATFAAGAITGSFLFFFSLGYGARWLRPLFARPSAWRLLEAGIAVIMWTIAARLLLAA